MTEVYFDENYTDIYDLGNTIRKAAKLLGQSKVSVSVSVMSDEEIRKLNASSRGVDSVTDVLSFPTLDGVKGIKITPKKFPEDIDPENHLVDIGCIAICEKRAFEQAAEFGHSVKREMSFLAVHGLMHLLGYDHVGESDEEEMTAKQREILTRLEIGRELV